MRAQQTTVVGVFDDRLEADRAVDDLRRAGFHGDQIGVALRYDGLVAAENENEAGEGAVAGTLVGLGLGALAGLGVISGVVPVIGPAIAGGTLGIILSNAAAGAAAGGLAGALAGAGIPEDESRYCQNEFEAGRTIVTVCPGGRVDEATAILRRHGASNMGSRPDAAVPPANLANKPVDVPVQGEDVMTGATPADSGIALDEAGPSLL